MTISVEQLAALLRTAILSNGKTWSETAAEVIELFKEAMTKEMFAEILAGHQGRGFAFRNTASGDLYDCTCGRRYTSLPEHHAEVLARSWEKP